MEQNRKRSGRGRRTLGALAALAGVLALTLAGVLAGCGAESRQSTRPAPIQPGTQASQVSGQELEGRLFFVNSADGSRITVLNGLEELWSRENTVARPVRDEALGRVLEFAFTEDSVHRITTGCLAENIGSQRVMIKSGLIREAEHIDCYEMTSVKR